MQHWCNNKSIRIKKQKHHEWSLNISYSKLLSKNCAGWNPIKLHKYKQYPYYENERKKLIEIEKF